MTSLLSDRAPSSDLFPESCPTYLNGVNQCDSIVHNFHKILLAGNNNLIEAENYFQLQQNRLQDQIRSLDELQAAILEEKRCLESQLHECKTQVTQARSRKRVILTESDRLMQLLTQELSHLAEEEVQLNTQHEAVDDRIAEMKKLMAQLDEQLLKLNTQATELRTTEAGLAREENELNNERNQIHQKEYQLLERMAMTQSQTEAVALWTRNLDARESDLAKVQASLLERLKQVEAEERTVGLDSMTLHKFNPQVITVRAVLDDHDMSIERDIDCEEIDHDDD